MDIIIGVGIVKILQQKEILTVFSLSKEIRIILNSFIIVHLLIVIFFASNFLVIYLTILRLYAITHIFAKALSFFSFLTPVLSVIIALCFTSFSLIPKISAYIVNKMTKILR